MQVLRFYQYLGNSESLPQKLRTYFVDNKLNFEIKFELCYNIEVSRNFSEYEYLQFLHLLRENDFKVKEISEFSMFNPDFVVEIGPRLNFCTPYSSNVVCILKSIGLDFISRFELSKIYYFESSNDNLIKYLPIIKEMLHDKMTESIYTQPINSFQLKKTNDQIFYVNILQDGIKALEKINKEMGLAMDAWDLKYYNYLFINVMKRNPTNVECFDLAQSNSEHSRHWFFKGDIIIDGVKKKSLFEMIMDTQNYSNKNNVIAFSDNSSAILGHNVNSLVLSQPDKPSKYRLEKSDKRHICFTAETHNFPTGVAPFPGAATGTGGRIRDIQAVGRGGKVVAATVGYCFGNLNLSGYQQPWELNSKAQYPLNMAGASCVAIEASNGASDYGNKFGEPVIVGFARSYGALTNDNQWREWIKPIMFSGGIGQVSDKHVTKLPPSPGQLVVKLGGPVYRIGVGGGAASSVSVQGDTSSRHSDLDYGAVQRGDPQMENKLNRVLSGCIDLAENNPILSIHDQGAGGNGNVLKELVEPLGADISADDFILGDPTINILELWGAEYQESNGLLIDSTNEALLRTICSRERCPISVVGRVTDTGRVRLKNWSSSINNKDTKSIEYPVDLDLSVVLGKMPRKQFPVTIRIPVTPCSIQCNDKIIDICHRVLRLPSVASKRYLTNKLDRSVTGLVAQQQCVGPLHTPLADAAVVAMDYFSNVGAATSIGEQPIKMLLDASKGARMSLIECLTNLGCVGGHLSDLANIKLSGNWMWPAKLLGEAALLWEACFAVCELMQLLGVAIDGGKDSLSMATTARLATADCDGDDEAVVVKAPGSLVLSAYVDCHDISNLVTPDFKAVCGDSIIIHLKLSSQHRLGGSALGQVYQQLGDQCPDIDSAELFIQTWNVLQYMHNAHWVLACHDISDGGLLTALLEMAFAGNVGINIALAKLSTEVHDYALLFNEEPGWILEINQSIWQDKVQPYLAGQRSILYQILGKSSSVPLVNLTIDSREIIDNVPLEMLRGIWEETSQHLEYLQCNRQCVDEEYSNYKSANLQLPTYHLTEAVDVNLSVDVHSLTNSDYKVAIIREEGSNGDKEMAAAFYRAGLECWDITMQDLLNGQITLDRFNGVAFVGGFSYGDVLGAGKGWAATILCHENLSSQFNAFRIRKNTFSLGVCNGCQLMIKLGWISEEKMEPSRFANAIRVGRNDSGRFESRFSTVEILKKTNSVMLRKLRGCRLGVWVSHGEGKFQLNDVNAYRNQFALVYSDGTTKDTQMTYPMNPNGSHANLAGMVSRDGRHLAMMPHPERTIRWPNWAHTSTLLIPQQHPSSPSSVSPWHLMFSGARDWLDTLCR